MIILFGLSKEEAFNISERIRRDIANFPFYSKHNAFRCTISIGLNTYNHSLSFIQNLEYADEALYAGKRKGKNRSVWYDEINK